MSDILESEIVDLVSSDDEEAESSQNVSEPNVRTHDYACIPCINKSLINPGETMDLNCLSCTLTSSDTERNAQYWCYNCNNIASCDCRAANHNIEIYNDYYHAQSLLIKSNMDQTNLICDEELQHSQKIQSGLHAIIAWIKVLQLEMTQRDSSSISASYLCQVFIAQLESLKTAGVFNVAEKEGNGILNYIDHLTTHFSDRLIQIQAAQTKVRSLLDKCSFLQESTQPSSQFSNDEPSSDLVNAITTAFNCNDQSCVDVLVSLLKRGPNLGSAPELDSNQSKKTDILKRKESVEVKIRDVCYNREPPCLKTSSLGKQRYPKRRAEEETESDTIKISKKSRGPPTVGFLHRETYDDQHVSSSFIFGQEIQSYPVPTPSIETISKGIGEMIDSGNENFTNYCATFKQIRSELAQNFQDAQIKLKTLEERTIMFANEAVNLPEKMAKRVTELEADLASMTEKAKLADESSAKARQEASSLLKHAQEIQEKYENELIQHTIDVGQLNAVREEMNKLEQSHSQQESKLTLIQQHATKLISEQTSWQAQKEMYEKENLEKGQKCAKRKKMIESLEKQITLLNSRIASATRCQEVLSRALIGEDTNSSLDSPVGEDDEMTKMILDQPLKMVHFLRREKDVAVTRCEVLETELQSLKTQLKETERQCIEFQATLSQEREERKVLIDSDRLLKDERDGLAGRVKEMTLEVSSLVSELGSLRNINQQSLCAMKKLSDENKMLRDQISTLKTHTDVLQEKLEETLTEIKQTNMQLIAAKLELEKEAALAKEASQKSQSDLVEALAKLEEKSSIALNYKTQFENLQIEHEKLVEEHEETYAVQSTRIQELEASIVKINVKLKELKDKNSVREKIRRKIQSFKNEKNFSNSNMMPQLVPVKVTSSPTSANFSDDSPNENKQLQLFSSVKGKNTYPVVESRLDVIPLGSAKFSDMEEATMNEQSFNLLCREFEVIVHAQNCHREGKEPNEEYTVCFCHPLKIVLKHSTSCHAGELCPVPNCWVSLAYQSEEVSNEITRLESDLQLVMEHAELAEDSEAVAHQEALNQVKLAIEARDKYENKLLQRTAKIEQLNIALEQSQSGLAAALEELASRPTLDDLRSQQSQKESVQKQLEQVQKKMEDIKQANFSEMEELKRRISQAEEEMKNLLSHEKMLQTHQEQMKQSRDKLSVQLKESQQINTKVVAEKQELERKLRTSKEEIKELRSQKESTKMELERLKQSCTTLTEQLANSHQNNTQLFAEKQELEEQHRVAKEEIRNLESHKALILTELEEILHSPLTEYQENSNQLIEKKLDLEDRVAKESWKLFSDKNALREKLKKTAHEVTQLRQKAVEYDELKICYDTRKLEHEKVLQERENLLRRVVQLRSGLEEAKKDYQVEERLRKKPRLETIQENQQDQKSASAKSTATTSVFNKVPQWMPQANPVSPTVNKVAPSASVVPSAGGSRGSHDSGKQPICVEAEDNHKSRKLFITRHDILNHARKCQLRQRNSNAKCHVPLCLESSLILNHIAKCKAGASCPTPHCLSSRKIIPYWKACNQLDCPLCYFRPVVNQNNSTSGVAITEVIEAVVKTSRSSFQQVTYPSQPTNPVEFCSSKRVEFLAMAMLTQLHNNGVNHFAYPCSYCKLQVETRLRCNVCSTSDFDFEMCTPCYNENGHNHEMVEIGFSLSVDSSNYNQTDLPERVPITLRIQSLVHSLECLNPNCYFLCCHRMKTIVKHMRSCEASVCRICYQLVALIIYHAKHDCSKTKSSKECAVPFCNFLKRRISSSANMSIQSAFEKLACVTRAKDSRSEDLIGNSWPHQPNPIRKKTPTEKVNPQLILPSKLCKYSEFGIY